MRDPIENVTRLQKQLNNLQLENQVLKNILDKAGLSYQNELASIRKKDTKEDFDPEQGKRIVYPKEITDRMAKLFFSFFWGRTDVYAKRNVNKNGEAAYYPQCDNFWSDNCHRKLNTHIDCKDCKYCSYTRLDLPTILMHLRGNSYAAKDVIGVYPLFSDGTCRFLVFDFDNHEKNAEKRDFANTDDTWIEEVEAMRDICTLNGIEPLVERSRSGKGAHIWIFFDKPISAAVVRKFGLALLDKGAEQVNLKSFNYYDRMLPAQDSLENVAIGNLIALPLQGRALKDGNSAFVDGNWNAYPDQWNALLSKPKLSEEFLENKIREWTFTADDLEASSDEENREKPWDMGLKSWKNAPDGKIVKTDVSIAKNYLGKEELAELNEIVTMYLDYATRQARRHIPMTMEDWKTKLDAFLRFNDAEVLQDKGKVTAAIAKEFAESEFEKYRVIQDSLYESDFDKLMNDMEKDDAIH